MALAMLVTPVNITSVKADQIYNIEKSSQSQITENKIEKLISSQKADIRTGRKLWISVYITFDKDIVSLSKFKHLQDKCIKALAQKYPDFYFELLPDIEFTGIEEE